MLWDDFGPFVLPYVPGCPHPTLVLHSKLAAIKFCTETKCWVRRLEPFAASGDHLLEIDAISEKARILDFDTVEVGGIVWPIVEADEGIRQVQADDSRPFCFSEDLSAIRIHPLQLPGVEVIVRASLVPAMSSTGLVPALEEHAEAISYGAIASLMRVLQLPSSETFEAMFRERIRAESSRLARGRIAVTPRALPSFM